MTPGKILKLTRIVRLDPMRIYTRKGKLAVLAALSKSGAHDVRRTFIEAYDTRIGATGVIADMVRPPAVAHLRELDPME